jgi:23S rRNA pseudouridine955/2504/2580 synthase
MEVKIKNENFGLRIDKFLCKEFNISFGAAQKLIREKKIKVNNQRCDSSYKLKDKDHLLIFSNLLKREVSEKEKIKISDKKISDFKKSIIFRDDNLIAINKPSGLAVQGGSGIEYCVDDFLPFLKEKEDQENFNLVHRLDKDTSGILLIACNKKTTELFFELFKNKKIKKTYLALVEGLLTKSSGVINIPLRKKFVEKNEKVYPCFSEGKEAITEFKVIKNFSDFSLLELKPITGRTHQLRVHCKEIGHPIINDVKYGGKKVIRKDLYKSMCLHAYQIEISDYFGKKLQIKTNMPNFIGSKNEI